MEGMISRGVVEIQREYYQLQGMQWRIDKWASGLVIKLLEVTHGQWLYRNVVVHDRVTGSLAQIRKEEIRAQIEEQQAHGTEGLLEEHHYLLEVNLDDLDETDGTRQDYWLLAIRAARVACAFIGDVSDRQGSRGRQRSRSTRQEHPPDGEDYG